MGVPTSLYFDRFVPTPAALGTQVSLACNLSSYLFTCSVILRVYGWGKFRSILLPVALGCNEPRPVPSSSLMRFVNTLGEVAIAVSATRGVVGPSAAAHR